MSQATHQDAELILKLYDLRREAVMREARNFVASFTPSSFDELWAVMSDFSTKENAYLRQVYTYWEMVAALVAHGTINAALADDTLGEMFFVYAKIQPFVKDVREKTKSPEFLQNMQKVVEATPEKRDRLKRVQERMAEFAKMQATAAKQGH
jgi:5'-deoxynucleotidase YfbR-like HD superfamily hydrolase